ncbi:MAG: glycosyltransferase [Thermoplasma acidophilum]|nr:glycosyltransferase [Thermoplasma acidophilum]
MHTISVIVTAFNRREYLRYALLSLKNQKADPFEVVVSKNFSDSFTDKFCSENGFINVTTDSSGSGERVYDALRSSHGDFILFLDDDDIFRRTKISRVYDVISKKSMAFYRNAIFPVTMDGVIATRYQPPMHDPLYLIPERVSDVRLLHKNFCGFNSSSMGISRDLLDSHVSDLRKISLAVDTFYFALAASSGMPLFCDNRIESIYRIMPSSTSRDLRDFDLFSRFERSFLLRYVPDLERIAEMVKGGPVQPVIARMLSLYRILQYIFEEGGITSKPSLLDRMRFLPERPFPVSLFYSRIFRDTAMHYEFRRENRIVYGKTYARIR